MGPTWPFFYSYVKPVRLLYNIGSCFHVIAQVVFLVEHRDYDRFFVKSWVPEKRDSVVWCRVTRHPRIFQGLTGCQRTPWIWGVIVI